MVLVAVLVFVPGAFEDVGVHGFFKEEFDFFCGGVVVPDAVVWVDADFLFVGGIGGEFLAED